jgi:hypothetical protein
VDNPNVLLLRIEQTRLWAYFHKDWLLQIRSLLRTQLPAEYHLFVESEAPNQLLPDVAVSRLATTKRAAKPGLLTKGTAAVVEYEEPCEIDSKYSLIIRRAPENLVVAALEILSPSNKRIGNRFDEEKHLRKRDSFLESGIQLMEVDGLVHGHRELPGPLMDKLGEYSRVAWTAAHFDVRRKYRGWGWNEPDPLPTIPWFVDRNVEVSVDLTESVNQAFDFNRWADLVTSAEANRSGKRL